MEVATKNIDGYAKPLLTSPITGKGRAITARCGGTMLRSSGARELYSKVPTLIQVHVPQKAVIARQ